MILKHCPKCGRGFIDYKNPDAEVCFMCSGQVTRINMAGPKKKEINNVSSLDHMDKKPIQEKRRIYPGDDRVAGSRANSGRDSRKGISAETRAPKKKTIRTR
jgi:hypothetical protein